MTGISKRWQVSAGVNYNNDSSLSEMIQACAETEGHRETVPDLSRESSSLFSVAAGVLNNYNQIDSSTAEIKVYTDINTLTSKNYRLQPVYERDRAEFSRD